MRWALAALVLFFLDLSAALFAVFGTLFGMILVTSCVVFELVSKEVVKQKIAVWNGSS